VEWALRLAPVLLQVYKEQTLEDVSPLAWLAPLQVLKEQVLEAERALA
jgi:hypothetical protein